MISTLVAFTGQKPVLLTVILSIIALLLTSWHKIFIPFDWLKQRKINKLLKLINDTNVGSDLKDLTKEQLQIEYFSYAFNLQANNIKFVEKILNLIRKSKGAIDINDFKRIKGYFIVENGDIKVAQDYKPKRFSPKTLKVLSYIPVVMFCVFLLVLYDQNNTGISMNFIIVYTIAYSILTIIIFFRLQKDRVSIKKIRTEIKRQRQNSSTTKKVRTK